MTVSDYLANKLLDHKTNKATYTPPATLYVALCSAAPVNSDTGSTITEVSYTGYARVAVTAADWNAAAARLQDNVNEIAFPAATGGSDTATHFALCDASSAGNLLDYGALSSSLAISSGVEPKFKAGDLDLTVDP